MPDFAFTDPERRLLQALHDRGIRFLIVGLGAALIEGAPVATLARVIVSKRATNRLKDRAVLPVLEATRLARESADS